METEIKGWDKWKVFFIGMATALVVVLEPYLVDPTKEIVWPQLGLAAGVAILAYIGNAARGQGETIFGFLTVLAPLLAQQLQSGTTNFNWDRTILSLIIATVFTISGPLKSRGYERSAVITQAKIEGEVIQPAPLTSVEIKKEAEVLKQTDQTKQL